MNLTGYTITEGFLPRLDKADLDGTVSLLVERLAREGEVADPAGLTAEAEANQLCVEGVEHGQRYRITFRKGLPAANGETLAKSIDLNVYVQDRDPSARFAGRAYVLPQRAGASVPVITVNIPPRLSAPITVYKRPL